MRIFCTNADGFTEEPVIYSVAGGEMGIRMAGTSAVVLLAEDVTD